MVATQVLRRRAVVVAAVAAAALLVGLALHGERERSALGRFQVSGLMAHIAPAEIADVEIESRGLRWRFVRDGAGWRALEAARPPRADAATRIEAGLRLLHVSAPERFLAGDELGARTSFGLEPPALRVLARSARPFAVAFGTTNPIGLARYAQVQGDARVALVPEYVAKAWEAVIESP